MASISSQPNGGRVIQFSGADKRRRSVRLGKMPMRTAEAIKVRIERLVGASLTGFAVDDETSRWLAGLDDKLADKLARCGLVQERDTASGTLGEFLDNYIVGREGLKPNTVRNHRTTQRFLVEHFGSGRALRTITPGDADGWKENLIGKGLSGATIGREVKRARQFFRMAVRNRLIAENPFADVKAPPQVNTSRYYFVTRTEADKVLESCPDAQWRLLFALGRYGGLRCPSEHLALRWSDIDWEHDRMTVQSPKTEHNPGGESRVVPIFPELRPHLEAAWELAEPGSVFVISRYRDASANLRTGLQRIIRRAGLKPWPKLWANLRSTRETELAERFPIHVVCAWIGNSQAVAAKHYLQVTDEHYRSALHNRVQQMHATARKAKKPAYPEKAQTPVLQGLATSCEAVHNRTVPPRGVEPLSSD